MAAGGVSHVALGQLRNLRRRTHTQAQQELPYFASARYVTDTDAPFWISAPHDVQDDDHRPGTATTLPPSARSENLDASVACGQHMAHSNPLAHS